MAYLDFISRVHQSTRRNYLERVTQADKAECAELAIKFDKDYWDGDRKTGYGGYRYDGRWKVVAEEMTAHYRLPPDDASTGDDFANLGWSIAARLKARGYLSNYDPLQDAGVRGVLDRLRSTTRIDGA